MNQRYAIGVDFGGTAIKTGLVNTQGEIVYQTSLPTRADEGPTIVIGEIQKTIEQVLSHTKKEILGIGISAAGIVEKKGGVIKNPPNFKNWEIVALGDEIKKIFSCTVEVENDANAAAIAEAKFGAGKNHKDFLFVIWGTGVGGGIIMDGKIYRGPFGGAGEIGHICIDYNGVPCNCGSRGCIEAYIGQRYLSQRTIEKLSRQSQSIIPKFVNGEFKNLEPIHIAQAANARDEFAKNILHEAGTLLGVALASFMNILDFRISIIGGGISGAGNLIFPAIQQSVVNHVQKPLKDGIQVLPAQLGNTAGILGAAGLVL